MPKFKYKGLLGSLPENGATDWWTEEHWNIHYAEVEELKKEGRYLEEVEIEVDFMPYQPFELNPATFDEMYKNFGLFIPKEHITITNKK